MQSLNVAIVATVGTAIGLWVGWAAARRGRPSSERLLDAAEAYVIILRSAMQCIVYPHDGEPRFVECRRLQGELWVLVSRIELLYGPGSKAAGHAAEATGALAALEVFARSDPYNEGDVALRERIDGEERSLEREYRAFVQATRAVVRADGRPPAATRLRARLRAMRSPAARGPERRPDRPPPAEQSPPDDDFLRDLDELLRDTNNHRPDTGHDAAREDHDTGTPPAR